MAVTPVHSIPLLEQLKAATRAAHHAVEQNPFNRALTQGTASLDQYAWFLEKMYGFSKPYEDQLSLHEFPPPVQIHRRYRSPLIVADLAALSVSTPPPVCADMPPLTTFEQLLGCMYVMEGSTLGGQYIARQLASASLPVSAYFTGYGADTGRMWKELCRFLTESAQASDQTEIIQSANVTFEKLNQWLDKP